jgi:hypothetical protein
MTIKNRTSKFPKGVSQPAIRAFEAAGYSNWEQLSGASESELLKLHGVGSKAIRIINQALIDSGKPSLRP